MIPKSDVTKMINFFKKGLNSKQVAAKFSSKYKTMQVAGVMAQYTRGAYKSSKKVHISKNGEVSVGSIIESLGAFPAETMIKSFSLTL